MGAPAFGEDIFKQMKGAAHWNMRAPFVFTCWGGAAYWSAMNVTRSS